MVAGGRIITTKRKFTGTIIPEYIPNPLIGIKGLKILAINATAVVLDVTAIALVPLLKA